MSDAINVVRELDTQGLCCPEPIMLIRKTIRELETGEVLLVLADDPTSIHDVASFCKFMRHTLLKQEVNDKPFQYWIQKG